MTVTNTDADTAIDDSKEVTEEDLHDLKYPKDDVENADEKAEDEASTGDEDEESSEEAGDEDGKTDDTAEEDDAEEEDNSDSDEADSEFVKEFTNIKGDTLEDYTRNLEVAYSESFKEIKRIRDEQAANTGTKIGETTDDEVQTEPSSYLEMYAKQQLDKEINDAYGEFSKHFPQVQDPVEYAKFTQEVATLSTTIKNSQQRLAPPKELYSKAAVILGWEPADKVTDKDRLGSAIKDSAATSKTTSGTKKASKSKVTDAMVAASRMMYPDKSDAQIREELEPYVN